MQNVLKLEELRTQVERLWKQIQEARTEERERVRREYQCAYERFRRAREWCAEMGLDGPSPRAS